MAWPATRPAVIEMPTSKPFSVGAGSIFHPLENIFLGTGLASSCPQSWRTPVPWPVIYPKVIYPAA